MALIYPTPQWSWAADDTPRSYGFVQNVVRTDNPEVSGYVKIPTEFFQALEVIYPLNVRAELGTPMLEFYLDVSDSGFLFGVCSEDGIYFRDLWLYTRATVPNWAQRILSRR